MARGFFAKTKVKIAIATSVVIFSLAAAISGSFAWFAANTGGVTIEGSSFSVTVTGSCGVAETKLYKFDYGTTDYGTLTTVDYLTPETGEVNVYDYNDEGKYFGVKEDDTWVSRVEAMNIYDPTDTVIRNISLKDVNCNAIYKIKFEAQGITSAHLVVSATLNSGVVAGENQILLSDCIDIDTFFEEDLADNNSKFFTADNPATTSVNEYDHLSYYPSYKSVDWRRYYKWNGSDWDVSTVKPTGEGVTDKGSIKYVDYLPVHAASGNTTAPSTGDFYQVLNVRAQYIDNYRVWNGSSWSVADTAPSGAGYAYKGNIRFLSDLPASSTSSGDYYHIEYDFAPLNEQEEVYYKISYLSSLEESHGHFYGNTPAQKQDQVVLVRNKAVSFTESTSFVAYVNVNYAPSKLNKYVDSIALNNIEALNDYSLLFEFLDSPRVFD